jgi:hypothetical protein
MRSLALATLALVSVSGLAHADLVFVSQSRTTSAGASLAGSPASDSKATNAPGLFDQTALARVDIDLDPGLVSSIAAARLQSNLSPAAISMLGEYQLSPGYFFGSGYAWGRTTANILFDVTTPTPFVLWGQMPAVPFLDADDPTPRRATLSGPGLDLSSPTGNFTFEGTMSPGRYTLSVDVLSRSRGPGGDVSEGWDIPGFSLNLQAVPAPGTLGLAGIAGVALRCRRRK